MIQRDWKARQEDLLDINDPDDIEERIVTLFKKLPLSHQSAVLDQLHEFLQDDDGDQPLD